jgi:acyl-CoA thioesterase I
VGIEVPPNYGADYSSRFAGLYDKVAKRHKAAVVPFMFKGMTDGADPTRMFQADRIHPTAAAQPLILDNVWPELKKLVAVGASIK